MNENINLVEILKDCPRGTKLYTPIAGEVKLDAVRPQKYRQVPHVISVIYNDNGSSLLFTKEGLFLDLPNGECLLFPSKDQRDWSKFKCSKPKFDPKTLQPFDKVIVKDYSAGYWNCDFFSRIDDSTSNHKFVTISSAYTFCIPYNDDTKHLVGTTDKAPEFYRYWED